jgi:reductive dehalogenase
VTRLFSHKGRPVHLGPYPLERLQRVHHAPAARPAFARPLQIEAPDAPASLANSMREYVDVMDRMRDGDVAPHRAPIPDDVAERSNHLKAACYYLDASMAATGRIPESALLEHPVVNERLAEASERAYGAGSADNPMAEISVREGRAAWSRALGDQGNRLDHRHALVIVIEHTREPDPAEPGGDWLAGTQPQRAAVRVAEVAAVMANYIRFLGFQARMHTATASELDLDALMVATGLGVWSDTAGDRGVEAPFLGSAYGVAVVSTDMELAAELPLAPAGLRASPGFRWWLGFGGTRPGLQGRPFQRRPFQLGPYPMERVSRVERPTTHIDEDAVPRIPKRHDMFIRAAIGDLGPKAKKELHDFRMITKSPFGHAMVPVLGGMVPLQYGEAAVEPTPGYEDPKRNAEAVKAALYYLGADMVGICEIPDYAWYSHDTDGSEIRPYHRYAISILVDQGYETMEGASGDDWISGAQSMRAYMRAQLIGGIVGAQLRRLGFSARGHSVMDQDVLHIPLILKSGLGELSRIGELVLNPFVGPRFKSGVITTDMPLEPDRPIDFGLQDFCGKCQKCARECPCTAIPFGDKIMFNGYEMWKPDVEKCSRYRIVNQAGSMCGRCMKTCPFNLEGVLAERPFLWMAMNLPFTRKWLADLDDRVGNGRINPVKKWWWDLDTDDEGRVVKARRVNERQLAFREPLTPEQQKLGCYPAEAVPEPTAGPTPPDRKAAMAAYRDALSPAEYRRRKGSG